MMAGQRMNAEIQKTVEYESERRRFARQHQRDSLRSMTWCERDRRRTAQHCSLHDALPKFVTPTCNFPRALRVARPADAYTLFYVHKCYTNTV